MSDEPLSVYVDSNDAEWTSHRYYIDSLVEQYREHERVEVVKTVDNADVVHLNFLNPLGRVVHGKVDRWRHLRDVARVIAGLNTPIVVTEHGVEEFSDVGESVYVESNVVAQKFAEAMKRQTSRVIANRIDSIIAISSIDQDALITAGFDPNSVHHIPHGVKDAFLNNSKSGEEDFILHVSKCSSHKNPKAIIEVAKQLDTTLKVAGDGWEENYGNELMNIENVDVLGYVSEEKLIELYSSACVFYFPSTYEPFGLPILESMACGTPVIASFNSAAPDICKESITLVDPHDIGQHVKELRRLLEDNQLRASYGRQAKKRAKSFTWARTADSTINVYEKLMVN